ncbi:hypothetical protein AC579_1843 [Pseudocercospora musae]|uniref:Uncharacterized protein n=1 Tax=Pseudocercospora musae TaxID=113226 RepID=A0A139GT04_9PEZI|nr:hypothetical protein AC579_1843 [Pseudocercospora musae]
MVPPRSGLHVEYSSDGPSSVLDRESPSSDTHKPPIRETKLDELSSRSDKARESLSSDSCLIITPTRSSDPKWTARIGGPFPVGSSKVESRIGSRCTDSARSTGPRPFGVLDDRTRIH